MRPGVEQNYYYINEEHLLRRLRLGNYVGEITERTGRDLNPHEQNRIYV